MELEPQSTKRQSDMNSKSWVVLQREVLTKRIT